MATWLKPSDSSTFLEYEPSFFLIDTILVADLSDPQPLGDTASLQDCRADNFESLTYTFRGRTGNAHERFLKYTFVEDNMNDEYYTLDGALNRWVEGGRKVKFHKIKKNQKTKSKHKIETQDHSTRSKGFFSLDGKFLAKVNPVNLTYLI